MSSLFKISYHCGKKKPWKWGWESPLSIVWISDTIKRYIHEEKDLWSEQLLIFLRRMIILMFSQEKLTSLLSAGKPFSSDLQGWKTKKTMVTPQGDTDFAKLKNLCPVKTFSLISTTNIGTSQWTGSYMIGTSVKS